MMMHWRSVAGLVFVSLVLAGCNLTYYFGDPAIRACRNDIFQTMGQASSYGDVRVHVDLNDGATGIAIDHDFLTADGEHHGATARCEFVFFNGFFHFQLPMSDDPDVHENNVQRWAELMGSGLAIIADQHTLLAPSSRDLAAEACIRTLGGGGEFPLPLPHEFALKHQPVKDGVHAISLISQAESANPRLPKSGQCEVTQMVDGTLQVTSHDVVR